MSQQFHCTHYDSKELNQSQLRITIKHLNISTLFDIYDIISFLMNREVATTKIQIEVKC